MLKILLVEDDALSRLVLSSYLSDEGFEVCAAEDGLEAISIAGSFRPDLLLSDWCLGAGLCGIELALHLANLFPRLRVVFVTGYPESVVRAESRELPGEIGVFEKPLDLGDLARYLHQLRLPSSPMVAAA